MFLHRYYYDKNILTKIQGKRYAYKFDFPALTLSCRAQQSPTPSDAKPDELYKNLAPLLDSFSSHRVPPPSGLLPPPPPAVSPPYQPSGPVASPVSGAGSSVGGASEQPPSFNDVAEENEMYLNSMTNSENMSSFTTTSSGLGHQPISLEQQMGPPPPYESSVPLPMSEVENCFQTPKMDHPHYNTNKPTMTDLPSLTEDDLRLLSPAEDNFFAQPHQQYHQLQQQQQPQHRLRTVTSTSDPCLTADDGAQARSNSAPGSILLPDFSSDTQSDSFFSSIL